MQGNYRKTTSLLLCALFTALIAVGAFIRIPIPLIPFTLQLWFTTMAGILLGPRLGATSVLVYVLLGLLGVPIFTQGGGPGYVFQPTFGYLLGFIVGTWLTGKLVWQRDNPTIPWLLFSAFSGLLVVYSFGTIYCFWISNYVLGTAISFWPLFVTCFILPLPGDLTLCVVSALLGKRLLPSIRDYQLS